MRDARYQSKRVAATGDARGTVSVYRKSVFSQRACTHSGTRLTPFLRAGRENHAKEARWPRRRTLVIGGKGRDKRTGSGRVPVDLAGFKLVDRGPSVVMEGSTPLHSRHNLPQLPAK